jgi:hypothetical protein
VWRKSGSHNASGSKLSAGDLAALRIDDLRDLVKKTGVCWNSVCGYGGRG